MNQRQPHVVTLTYKSFGGVQCVGGVRDCLTLGGHSDETLSLGGECDYRRCRSRSLRVFQHLLFHIEIRETVGGKKVVGKFLNPEILKEEKL